MKHCFLVKKKLTLKNFKIPENKIILLKFKLYQDGNKLKPNIYMKHCLFKKNLTFLTIFILQIKISR